LSARRRRRTDAVAPAAKRLLVVPCVVELKEQHGKATRNPRLAMSWFEHLRFAIGFASLLSVALQNVN
jgi:hypothetical protein